MIIPFLFALYLIFEIYTCKHYFFDVCSYACTSLHTCTSSLNWYLFCRVLAILMLETFWTSFM